jgi:starch synthase
VERAELNVLMVASEAAPWAKSGGLADVVGALPAALAALGHRVTTILPRYRGMQPPPGEVRARRVRLGAIDQDVHLHVGEVSPRHRVILVDAPVLYNREGYYGEGGQDYADNAVRFATLAAAALDHAAEAPHDRRFDVVHAHDWQTGLVPALLRSESPFAASLRHLGVVFTIHNLAYQGRFPRDIVPLLGLAWSTFSIDRAEFWGEFSFLKAGITFSDYVTTVSPTYARETQRHEGGMGMDGVLALRASRYAGILNGIDTVAWNPETDTALPAAYTADDLSGKAGCKRALLEQFGMAVGDDALARPMVAFLSRMVAQKGLDLIAAAAPRLVALDATWLFVGTGEQRYERLLRDLAVRHPGRVATHIGYDEKLAHLVQGGADMMLMPSTFEPCGLTQLYALRYGTVPVVTPVGGLDDSVQPYTARARHANGFKLRDPSPDALVRTLRQAIRLYRDQAAWRALIRQGMAVDLSWQTAAKEYVKVYRRARALAAIRGGL